MVASAVVDRLLHQATALNVRGKSYRNASLLRVVNREGCLVTKFDDPDLAPTNKFMTTSGDYS